MAERQIERSPGFEKDLKQLSRKHHDLEDAVEAALQEIAKSERPLGDQIPGLNGAPVYKLRIKCGNKGKRGGARMIFYCAEALVRALYLYAKNEDEDIPRNELRAALKAAALLPDEPAST